MRAFLSAILCFSAVATAQNLDAGRRLYVEHCALCHGLNGYDGIFANIAQPRLVHAPDDASLFRLIKNGFEGTDMPPAYGVTDAEVRDIIAYARSLGRVAGQVRLPGDARRGEQIYRGKGNCTQCHMIAGTGGRQGPDLTDIGSRRGAAHLRQSLTEPEAALPSGYLQVRVKTRAGREVAGVRLNEDTLSIQLRDLEGNIQSFWKTELAGMQREAGKSIMPGYRGTLTDAELDDLVAYLAALRGGS